MPTFYISIGGNSYEGLIEILQESTDLSEIKDIKRKLKRILQDYKEIQAKCGISTPPEVLMAIEDIEEALNGYFN